MSAQSTKTQGVILPERGLSTLLVLSSTSGTHVTAVETSISGVHGLSKVRLLRGGSIAARHAGLLAGRLTLESVVILETHICCV